MEIQFNNNKYSIPNKRYINRIKASIDEVGIWSKYITDSDIIFDIGTNIGLYAMQFSFNFPNSFIYCFDAMPDIVRDYWNYNNNVNKITNTKFYEFGFSNQNAELEFYMPNFDSDSDIEVYSYLLPEKIKSRKRYGKVYTLNNFIDKPDIKVDVIKIDAEGAELDIINGGLEIVNNCKTLILEMPMGYSSEGDIRCNTIHSILSEFGFKHVTTTTKFNRVYIK